MPTGQPPGGHSRCPPLPAPGGQGGDGTPVPLKVNAPSGIFFKIRLARFLPTFLRKDRVLPISLSSGVVGRGDPRFLAGHFLRGQAWGELRVKWRAEAKVTPLRPQGLAGGGCSTTHPWGVTWI